MLTLLCIQSKSGYTQIRIHTHTYIHTRGQFQHNQYTEREITMTIQSISSTNEESGERKTTKLSIDGADVGVRCLNNIQQIHTTVTNSRSI